MAKIIDNIWLWGQDPGSHHIPPRYNLPGENKMTAIEGCDFFGIKNCCRVAMEKGPFPPFDNESIPLDKLNRVIWSVVGSGGIRRNEEEFGDLNEVIRQAQNHPNVVGGIMDDFLVTPRRREIFTPDVLRKIKAILRNDAGRPLEYWTVYYDRELDLDVQEYLDVFDVITYWTWYGENLWNLEKTLEKIFAANPGKRFYCGCYMWDYGNAKPLTPELMQHQLDVYYKYMKSGKLEGIIICSNCISDIGLPTVKQMQDFIKLHGNEEI